MGMVGYISPDNYQMLQKQIIVLIFILWEQRFIIYCGQTPYDTKNMRDYFDAFRKKLHLLLPMK